MSCILFATSDNPATEFSAAIRTAKLPDQAASAKI